MPVGAGSRDLLFPVFHGSGLSGTVEEEDGEEEKEHSALGTVLLYLPNRIIDALDIVRFGVNAGVGFGADATATWVAQAAFISDTSVGIGFQGIRHLPVCLRMGHKRIAVGPLQSMDLEPLDWPINPYDIRCEVFVLFVGAHAAVDIEGILDFVAGLFTLDPSEDDFVFGG